MTDAVIRFGEFALDPVRGELRKGSTPVAIQPQTFEGLRFFLANPGELHDREALHAALWPGVFVADGALSQLIRKIRKALGDDPKAPRYLVTVPRRGYRFVADVQHDSAATVPTEAPGALFGRETAFGQVQAALQASTCVAITGTGGFGKSHLARAVYAARTDSALNVDLQDVSTEAGFVRAVADALDVPLLHRELAANVDQLGQALATLRGTVVLDDLDGLREPARRILPAWMAASPRVRWLLTSRRPPGLPGEATVDLQPLPLDGARALFRARSSAGAVDDEALDRLLTRLDQSPLAIELAAARTRVLGVEQLIERLDSRFAWLRTRNVDTPDRHRSLEACLMASWERLEPELRDALAVLSVLRGPFDPTTAETLLEVCGTEFGLEVLEDLAEHALLHREADPARVRLKVLESVSAFTRDQSEITAALARAEAEVDGVLAQRMQALSDRDPLSPEQARIFALWVEALGRDTDPRSTAQALPLAVRWLRQRGPLELGYRVVGRLMDRIAELGPEEKAKLHLARLALERDPSVDQSDIVADAVLAAGRAMRPDLALEAHLKDAEHALLLGAAGELEERTVDLLDRARALGTEVLTVVAVRLRARVLVDTSRTTEAHALLEPWMLRLKPGPDRADLGVLFAYVLATQGRIDEARASIDDALKAYQLLGWRRREAVALSNFASVLAMHGHADLCAKTLKRARILLDRIGDGPAVVAVLINQGLLELFEHDGAAAEALLVDAERRAQRLGLDGVRPTIAHNRATARWLQADLEGALGFVEQGLELSEDAGNTRQAAMLRAWRAALLAGLGRTEEAKADLERAAADTESEDEPSQEVLRIVALHVQASEGPVDWPSDDLGPRGQLLVELGKRRSSPCGWDRAEL